MKTLTEVISHVSQFYPDQGVTLITAARNDKKLSYERLYQESLKMLHYLQLAGVKPKDELVFQIEDNESLIVVFWACISGGIIAVPVSMGVHREHKLKLFNVWQTLNSPHLISSKKHLENLLSFDDEIFVKVLDEMREHFIDVSDINSSSVLGDVFASTENDIAYVQFSSGSTGEPKGVILTHKNILSNIKSITAASGYNTSDSMISWMPLTHDMGMIGFHINPLYCGINQYLIPTSVFIRKPRLWLDKATEYKITILCSPNFGYTYLLKNTRDNMEKRWELSHVRLIYNGAEPISIHVIDQFLLFLKDYGLKAKSMCPVYGLAEATLAVSIPQPSDEIKVYHLNRNKLTVKDRIEVTEKGDNSVSLVNVGKPVNDCFVRLYDSEGIEVEDETVGHIYISGDGVTSGYYNNQKASQNLLHHKGWLNTGDIGFMKDGELCIVGRSKDIIFINGQNYFSHDIERALEDMAGVELNKVLVAGFSNLSVGKEEVLVFVISKGTIEEFAKLAQKIKLFISGRFGFDISKIFPVKQIPKTTSGKLQRFKLLEQYKLGRFYEIEEQLRAIPSIVVGNERPLLNQVDWVQTRVLMIWEQLLNRKAIGIDEDFFECGGNSLKAAEFASALLQEFKVDLSIEKLYDQPTVKGVAELIIDADRHLGQFKITAGRTEEINTEVYPASSAQKRIYYTWLLNKDTTAYNVPVALRINGHADIKRLEGCIQQLIARHESLRTYFLKNEEVSLKILNHIDFTLNCIPCAEDDILETLKLSVQKFDLHNDLLFRIKLFCLDSCDAMLFLDFHHSIADGLSIGIFIKELDMLYTGLEIGPSLVGYKDFAILENQVLKTGTFIRQTKYWIERFEGNLPRLELPADFQRPAFFDTVGGRIFRSLPKNQVKLLRDFAKRNQCQLQVVFISLYRVFLSKYSGSQDIIVGVPASGRKDAKFQNTFGMFANTLPIRTKLMQDDSFLTILEREKESFYGALQHQSYPFQEIVKQVDVHIDRSRNAVFDTMLMFNSIKVPGAEEGNLIQSVVNFDPGFSKFDISLEILDHGLDELTYCIEYATKLFSKATILTFADHFDHLIDLLLQEPRKPLSDITILLKEELEDLKNQEYPEAAHFSKTENIYSLFEQIAEQNPDLVAVEEGRNAFTYTHLKSRILNLANKIENTLTMVPNDIIAIFLPRSEELITSLLSALKAGATILPVDINLPISRVEYLLSNSKCKAVVTNAAGSNYLKNLSIPLISTDEIDLDAEIACANTNKVIGGTRAYVIYTSGTTGEPKGVEIDHYSLINYVDWAIREYLPKDRKCAFPFFTSISFDLTLTSIFVPLLSGNKIVVYDENLGASVLSAVFKGNDVDVIKLTPSHLRLAINNDLIVPESFSSEVTLIVGGEMLDFELAKQVSEKFNQRVRIFNEYGPTEATIGCMIYLFDPKGNSPSVPIGKPAQNTQIYILDQFLHPVPRGVIGELYISGDCISRGYLFNESLTGEKFINNPFKRGEKMYKSGDLVKRQINGQVEFIGRNDSQVKINGYRIELSEIEFQIKTHKHIEQVVVLVKLNDKGKGVLYAYFIREGGEVNEALLKAYLAGRVPYYMIPERMIEVSGFTVNSNGKIDLSKLSGRLKKHESGIAAVPVNELQKDLISVWQEVLNIEHISVYDNFFELGGDSIKAVQISGRALAMGLDVQVKDILSYHTIDRISTHAKRVIDYTFGTQDVVTGKKMLSPIEHWFFNQELVDENFYHQCVLLKFDRQINKTWIKDFLDWAIRYHDGLRLNYEPVSGGLFYNDSHLAKTHKINEISVDLSRLRALSPIELDPSFNIEDSLLIQISILEDMKTGSYLYITAHHLVIDGLSWRVLLEDLYLFYKARQNNEPPIFAPKTASLIDWMNVLDVYSEQMDVETEKKYWKRNLQSSHQVLPSDFQTDDWRLINAKTISGTLNKEDTAFLLKNANINYRSDAYILLLTALAMAIRNWTAADSFTIYIEGHGRNLPGINVSRTTGWFTSVFPINLILDQGSIEDQIMSVKEQIRNIPNYGVGFGILKYNTDLLKDEIFNLADIRFNYLGQFSAEFNNDLFSYDRCLSNFESAMENNLSAKVDCNVLIVKGELQLEIIYNQKAHAKSTIVEFQSVFFRSLDSILEHLKRADKAQFTPSDFRGSMINQQDIDVLFD